MNNVIILGAGASVDAGIPMLKNFVQTMWEIAIRGSYKDYKLNEDEKKIFSNAIKVRDDLDLYHGRSNFDDKNIEDILSILSFNLFENKPSDKNRMKWIIDAIERTIDLTCKVKHDGNFKRIQNDDIELYKKFWRSILSIYNYHKIIPSILTFNYDLVLERSLMQLLTTKEFNTFNRFPVKGININYYFDHFNTESYKIDYVTFGINESGIIPIKTEDNDNFLDIDILKLHGSVNFPNKKVKNKDILTIAENPVILPPVFNKMNNKAINNIWKEAIVKLRNAVNIIFIGYSLPQTDVYMQYFIKSSIGPNKNINKIIVFDPVFYKKNDDANKMKDRFKSCFSPQFHDRIYFNSFTHTEDIGFGTYAQFVNELEKNTEEILFL